MRASLVVREPDQRVKERTEQRQPDQGGQRGPVVAQAVERAEDAYACTRSREQGRDGGAHSSARSQTRRLQRW